MWQELWVATALVLIIEGVLPFLSPGLMRRTLESVTRMDDKSLRMAGFFSMLAGLALLYFVN